MEEARSYDMTGYSVWPYTNEHSREPFHILERSRQFFYSFKNGRSYHYEDKNLDFEEIVASLVKKARSCPAFGEASLLVPIPRSGMSEPSFAPGAEEYPSRVLAQRLADALPGGHRAVELFTRCLALPPSSLSGRRPSLSEHMGSLGINRQAIDARPIVLIDDLVTKGTQSMACLVKLRRAGLDHSVSGFYVAQVVHRGPSILQQQPYLVHRIEYRSGEDYPRRSESTAWRDCPNQGFSGSG
jgi:hypothetical protein